MKKYELGKNVKDKLYWNSYGYSQEQIVNQMSYIPSKRIDSKVLHYVQLPVINNTEVQLRDVVRMYVILESVRYGL